MVSETQEYSEDQNVRFFRGLFIVLLSLFVFISVSSTVYAHPLDEIGDVKVYDQKQTLTLSPEKTILTIELTFYPMEKIKVWESIDANRDQQLTQEEKDTWMKKGQEASWIETQNGKSGFEAKKLEISDYYDFFSSKPKSIQISFESEGQMVAGNASYFYIGKDRKLEELDITIQGQDGLKVDTITKNSPDSISFNVSEGEGGGTVLGMATGSRLQRFLDTYVKASDIPTRLFVFAFFIAFFLGAFHALTPGHGKAIVASYLVGSRGTIWHAINLGAIVTITHTASVFLLGIASVLLTSYFVPSTVVKTLNTISGLGILIFGIYLIIKRGRRLFASDESIREEHSHSHHDHLHSHTHEDGTEHHHDEIGISWKNLVPLGISGGIVPCVDALAILIVAISLQKTALGLLLLVSFSLGLAAALVSIGIVAVLAKDQLQKRVKNISYIEKYVSLLSAIVVTLLGVGILMGVGI